MADEVLPGFASGAFLTPYTPPPSSLGLSGPSGTMPEGFSDLIEQISTG